jgi:hypothetical protein
LRTDYGFGARFHTPSRPSSNRRCPKQRRDAARVRRLRLLSGLPCAQNTFLSSGFWCVRSWAGLRHGDDRALSRRPDQPGAGVSGCPRARPPRSATCTR